MKIKSLMTKTASMAVSALLTAGMAAPVTAFAEEALLQETMTVHFIDVGQGLAIMAQTGDEVLVYDGGNKEASSYFISYLMQNGVDDIDYMISSHYDSDHLSGLIGALNVFDVDTVIASDYEHGTQLYNSFYDTLEKQGKSVIYPEVGEEFEFGEGSFTVLSPGEITDDSNNNSVAIRLDYGDVSFIFTGDAEHEEEEDMIAGGIDLDCDVLSAGHHGSASSSSWDFVEATLPEYVVFSCGLDNSYGHPDPDTLEKFESIEAQIFRTDEQGNIIATTDGTGITWNTTPSNTELMYSTASLNVREEPNTDCAVLGQFAAGDEVSVLAAEDGWATVVYNGATAYVSLDYLSEEKPVLAAAAAPQVTEPVQTPETQAPAQPVGQTVWLSETGSKYHRINNCGNMNPANARQVTESDAIAQGFGKCKKCW